MMRPAKLVEQQVGLALGVYCGGRGHGACASAARRRASSDDESVIFSLCGYWICGTDLGRSSGFRLPARRICAFSERNSSGVLPSDQLGEKRSPRPGEAWAAHLHLSVIRRD
jgi:hypothetical protein